MKNSILIAYLLFAIVSTAFRPVVAQEDLVYVPVNPCRIVDTRVAGGAITANTYRNFRVAGTTGELAVQGGQTNCLDPKSGTGQKPLAISAYVIAVPAPGSTSGGVLTAYPSDQPPPPPGAGSTVNFAAGQVIGNTTNITLCDQVTCPANGEFAILARNTREHVVIDVQGYFYPPAVVNTVMVYTAYDYGSSYGSVASEVAVATCPAGSLLTGGGAACTTDNADFSTTNHGVLFGSAPAGDSYVAACVAEALTYSSILLGPPISVYAICAYSSDAVSPQSTTAGGSTIQAASADSGGHLQQGEPSEEALLAIESLKASAAALESRINNK